MMTREELVKAFSAMPYDVLIDDAVNTHELIERVNRMLERTREDNKVLERRIQALEAAPTKPVAERFRRREEDENLYLLVTTEAGEYPTFELTLMHKGIEYKSVSMTGDGEISEGIYRVNDVLWEYNSPIWFRTCDMIRCVSVNKRHPLQTLCQEIEHIVGVHEGWRKEKIKTAVRKRSEHKVRREHRQFKSEVGEKLHNFFMKRERGRPTK
jgi:hypothetical protein